MDMATPALAKHGNQHVRETFLRPSISGDIVACLGVSEPGAGSDVAQIKVVSGLISGLKIFVDQCKTRW